MLLPLFLVLSFNDIFPASMSIYMTIETPLLSFFVIASLSSAILNAFYGFSDQNF